MASFTHLVKQLLRRAGLVIATSHHAGVRYLADPPVTTFDAARLQVFPKLHGLRFIQVGANDGVQADPINRYVAKYGWTGLMLEPLGNNFRSLERNRGGLPGMRCRQAAVDSTIGRRLVYDLKFGLPGLPDWARGLGSFDRERLQQAIKELRLDESAISAEEVDTITWDQVWDEFGSAQCDLLLIDTEGHDIRLLRLADLAVDRPTMIHFEHGCVGVGERLDFYRELFSLGYEIVTQEADTIAYLPIRLAGSK